MLLVFKMYYFWNIWVFSSGLGTASVKFPRPSTYSLSQLLPVNDFGAVCLFCVYFWRRPLLALF